MTSCIVSTITGILICPEMPWVAVTPDRLAIAKDGEIIPIEIKGLFINFICKYFLLF